LLNRGFWLPEALPNREEGEPNPHSGRASLGRGCHRLGQEAAATARSAQKASLVAGLACFFPEATPVRIPVQLARVLEGDDAASARFSESTVIEFGTPREVLFSSSTPLEFADAVRLRTSDGSLDVEASVVAVQYHPGKTVVAARFLKEVPNWIVKS